MVAWQALEFFSHAKGFCEIQLESLPPQRRRQIRVGWVKLAIFDQLSCPTVTSYRRKFVFIRHDVRRRRHGALAERYGSVVMQRSTSKFVYNTDRQPCTVTRDVISSVYNNQLLVSCCVHRTCR